MLTFAYIERRGKAAGRPGALFLPNFISRRLIPRVSGPVKDTGRCSVGCDWAHDAHDAAAWAHDALRSLRKARLFRGLMSFAAIGTQHYYDILAPAQWPNRIGAD